MLRFLCSRRRRRSSATVAARYGRIGACYLLIRARVPVTRDMEAIAIRHKHYDLASRLPELLQLMKDPKMALPKTHIKETYQCGR